MAVRYVPGALGVFLLCAIWGVADPGRALAAEVTKLMEVPSHLAPSLHSEFASRREKLAGRLEALRLKFSQFDKDCTSVEEGSAEDAYCQASAERLTGQLGEYDSDVRAFNSRLALEEAVSVFTGQAFRMGEEVRSYLRESLDSARQLSGSLIGLWHAARGSYRRAGEVGRYADIGDAELLREMEELLRSLEQEKRERLSHAVSRTVISGEFDERLYGRYPEKFGFSLLEAFLNTKWRNYDTALRHLEAAAKMDISSQAVAEAATYVRQMKASQMARLSSPDPAHVEHQRLLASAHAGWTLGLLLYDADMDEDSINVLSEAAGTLAQEGDIEDSAVIYELRNAVPKKLPRGKDEPRDLLPLPGVYADASEADILLDSLEYGRGDWKRSLRFLSLARQASPENKNIKKALAHLQALEANRK